MIKIRQWFCILAVLMAFSIFAVGANAVTLDEIKNYRPEIVTYHYYNNGTGGFNFAINNTFTLDAGNPASVFNIGNSTNVVLDFFIPKGADGANGSNGSNGEGITINQSAYLMVNGTNKMESNLSMNTHYITNVSTPSISSDVSTKGYVDSVNTSMKNYVDAIPVWQTWNPNYVWVGGSGTPTISETDAKYYQTGKTVFFSTYFYTSNSLGATLVSISLPVNYNSQAPNFQPFTALERYGTSYGTKINPLAYTKNSDNTKIAFHSSMAGTSGQGVDYAITGFYEVS